VRKRVWKSGHTASEPENIVSPPCWSIWRGVLYWTATKSKPTFALLANLLVPQSQPQLIIQPVCIRDDRRLPVKPVHRFAKTLSD